MANFITKAKKTIRRITALTTGAALLTTSLAGAAFAADLNEYPEPFVQNGVWRGIIVVGSGASGAGAAADVIGATDIATTLTEVITTGGRGVVSAVSITGESARIESGGDRLNFNEYFSDIITAFDDSDLPMILADGDYKDNEGNNDNEETYTQELSWAVGSGPLLVFAKDDDGNEAVGDYILVDDGDLFYNYTFGFDTDIEYDNTSSSTAADDLEDTTIDMLGKPFIISNVETVNGAIDEIELLTGDTIVVLTKGQEFTFDGSTVKVTAVTDPDASDIECGVSVDGTVKFIDEGDDEEFDGLRIGVSDVFAIHGATEEDACELTLGSDLILLDNGGEIEIGGIDIGDREGDPDVVTNVAITSDGTTGLWAGFNVEVFADDDIYIGSETDGDDWEDPAFGAFKISYAGLSGSTERVAFSTSGDTGEFVFMNNDNEEVEIEFFRENNAFNIFFGNSEDKVMLVEDDTLTNLSAMDLSDPASEGLYAIDANNEFWAGKNVFFINDSTEEIDALEGTQLFVVTSGQTARVIEIREIDPDASGNGHVSFQDLTYGVDYDNEGDVNDTEDGNNPESYSLSSVGTITLTWFQHANGPAVMATNINLADINPNLDTDFADDAMAAETESETLIDLNWGLGNITSIILRENSDVTDVVRQNITVLPEYNAADEELLLDTPDLDGAVDVDYFDFEDADEDNDNDRYAMTVAGSLVHTNEDDDSNINKVNVDLVMGEARFAEAFISEISAVIVGGADTITEEVVTTSVTSLPVVKLDTEVVSKTAQPLILVGGPAVNRLTAEALGLDYPTYGGQLPASLGLTEGVGIIKLVENAFGGSNVALVVAGWEAQNTRDAANVLKDYSSYALSGSAVQVTSSAGVLTVGPVVVTTTEEVEETTEETGE
jgi:hypothetical protein